MSAVLIVLGCVLAPISVLAVWTSIRSQHPQIRADHFTADQGTGRPGGADRQDQPAVTKQIDVQGVAKQAANELSARGLTRLGALISNFSGRLPAASAASFTARSPRSSPALLVTRLWVQGTRSHKQLVLALEGKEGSITVSTTRSCSASAVSAGQAGAGQSRPTLVDKLPPINPTFRCSRRSTWCRRNRSTACQDPAVGAADPDHHPARVGVYIARRRGGRSSAPGLAW
jgi:hypothetical protein